MKERQRWQPEEDAILKAYVKQYGPKDWSLVSQRTGEALSRDPKSCLERWKNYLKPGIKKGSLTLEEQSLVISLQAKYGNKWKKIAAELPGRTAKRLGKWWEVFKEKQLKQLQKTQQQQQQQHQHNYKEYPSSDQGNIPSPGDSVAQGRYDHILETFAEKYVQPKLFGYQNLNLGPVLPCSMSLPDPDPVLSLGTGWTAPSFSSSSATTASPSVSLSLSPSEPRVDQDLTRCLPTQSMGTLLQYCKELEEGRQSWLQHKKEATWRLSRLEQQLESEKARKMREKMEEIEAKMICLREEEIAFLGRVESEYRDQLVALQRDAESKEAKLMEAWRGNHVKFSELIEQIRLRCQHVGFNAGTKDIHRST